MSTACTANQLHKTPLPRFQIGDSFLSATAVPADLFFGRGEPLAGIIEYQPDGSFALRIVQATLSELGVLAPFYMKPRTNVESLTTGVTCWSTAMPETKAPPLISVPEKLTRIRHWLSLNASELATVLRIERPTLYAWLEDSVELRKANRDRLDTIYNIADEAWRRLHRPLPRSILVASLGNASSLLALLEVETPSIINIRTYFQAAAEKIRRSDEERSRRFTPFAEVAKREGLQKLDPESVKASQLGLAARFLAKKR